MSANRFDQPTGPISWRDRPSMFTPKEFIPDQVPQNYVPLPLESLNKALSQSQERIDKTQALASKRLSQDAARSAVSRGIGYHLNDQDVADQLTQHYQTQIDNAAANQDLPSIIRLGNDFANDPVRRHLGERNAGFTRLQKELETAELQPGEEHRAVRVNREIHRAAASPENRINPNYTIAARFDKAAALDSFLDNVHPSGGGGFRQERLPDGRSVIVHSTGQAVTPDKLKPLIRDFYSTNQQAQEDLRLRGEDYLFRMEQAGIRTAAQAKEAGFSNVVPSDPDDPNSPIDESATLRNYANNFINSETEAQTRLRAHSTYDSTAAHIYDPDAGGGGETRRDNTIPLMLGQTSFRTREEALDAFKTRPTYIRQGLVDRQVSDPQYKAAYQDYISRAGNHNPISYNEFRQATRERLISGEGRVFGTGHFNSIPLSGAFDKLKEEFEAGLPQTMTNTLTATTGTIGNSTRASQDWTENVRSFAIGRSNILHNEDVMDRETFEKRFSKKGSMDETEMHVDPISGSFTFGGISNTEGEQSPQRYEFSVNNQNIAAANLDEILKPWEMSQDPTRHTAALNMRGSWYLAHAIPNRNVVTELNALPVGEALTVGPDRFVRTGQDNYTMMKAPTTSSFVNPEAAIRESAQESLRAIPNNSLEDILNLYGIVQKKPQTR